LEKIRRKSTQTNLQQINNTKNNSTKKNSYEKNEVAIAKNSINKSTKNWSHMKKKNPTTTFKQLLKTKIFKNKKNI